MASESQQTLLVIDGHSLAFRAFFALPPESFTTKSGLHTNAVHGFLQMLLSLFEHEKPTHVAVAFDLSRHSFRTDEYPEYKGGRSETPPEFIGQVEALERALQAMNIVTLTKENFEADDILATLATEAGEAGFSVLLVSGDQDIVQLVTDHVTLLAPRKGVNDLVRFDPEAVFAKYGVDVEHFRDYAALKGEVADNLPGIPKVGPVTAAKWITAYGDLEGVIAHQDEIRGKVGESLREHVGNAVRNKRLNRLITDLELPVTLDDLRLTEINRPMVDEVFGELELRTVGARVRQLGPGMRKPEGDAPRPSATAPVDPPVVSASVDAVADVVTAEPPVARTASPTEAASWLAQHTDTPLGVFIDVSDRILTVGVASADEAIDVVVDVDADDARPVIDWLASEAPKVLFEVKAALHALWSVGLDLAGVDGDAMLAWYVSDSTRSSYTLEKAAERYFTAQLPEADPNQLIPADDPASAGVRAWFARQLNALLVPRLGPDSGERVLSEIELPVTRVLAGMEWLGITVDQGLLESLHDTLIERLATISSSAFASIGREVNLASPKQLQEVLFDQLGLPKTRKLKTGYSTDAESLTDLAAATEHEFPLLLLQHRDAAKLRQMIETLQKSVSDDGRIHTRYIQTGAATGRLASADPNLQNIPVRTDEGKRIRAAFVAGAGYEGLLSADYSQIEMRIMAHLSHDEGLIEAFRSGEDLHNYVGAKVYGVEPDQVSPEMRGHVKAMSYGLVYGLSAFGLARQLRISQADAKALMVGYFQRFGGVRDYLRNVVEQARRDGYTTTVYGRRRLFPDLHSSNRAVRDNAERAALNAPIQGTAADIMKIAMLGVDRALRAEGLSSHTLLQVHDELILEVAPGERPALEELVVREMKAAARLDVPVEVHVGFGHDWNEAAH